MKLGTVNHLNIGLMVLSLAAAFALPFELFLFSYAVLGPLHYLTEISWLSDRGFFTKKKHDWIPLVALGVLIVLGQKWILGEWHSPLLMRVNPDLTFAALGLGLIFATIGGAFERTMAALALIVLIVSFHGVPASFLFFGLYVPTIVHVCLFTGAFILFGALRAQSPSGYVSFAVFLVCIAVALLAAPDAAPRIASRSLLESYQSFASVNVKLAGSLGLTGPANASASGNPFFPFGTYADVFTSPAGVRVMRFIAFAYTYHYLNWFSKTSIIGWHKVPKARIAIVVVLWVLSLALYAADYTLGVKWLFFLSFLHVLLEFPLNHMSFIGIGKELMTRAAR